MYKFKPHLVRSLLPQCARSMYDFVRHPPDQCTQIVRILQCRKKLAALGEKKIFLVSEGTYTGLRSILERNSFKRNFKIGNFINV